MCSIAGSDTTATTLRVLILYLLSSPQVYARLLSEIAETKTSQPITDAEARSMPYLQAIIKEGLRIHPPVTGLLFKEVPRGGDTLNGLFLPEGTKLGWSVWGAMRDKSFWGEDARIFRPERMQGFSGQKDGSLVAQIKSKRGNREWKWCSAMGNGNVWEKK